MMTKTDRQDIISMTEVFAVFFLGILFLSFDLILGIFFLSFGLILGIFFLSFGLILGV